MLIGDVEDSRSNRISFLLILSDAVIVVYLSDNFKRSIYVHTLISRIPETRIMISRTSYFFLNAILTKIKSECRLPNY